MDAMMARELGKTPEMEDLYGPVIVASVAPARELPEITSLDLSDLLSAQEREEAIAQRDEDAALNLDASAWDVWFAHARVPNESTWIREMCDTLYP